jgi:hypothetical protein
VFVCHRPVHSPRPPQPNTVATDASAGAHPSFLLPLVLEHASLASVGSRLLKQFDLVLIRYDTPSPLPSPAAPTPSNSHIPTLSLVTNKPRAPVLHYSLSTPSNPVGPSDLVFTSLFIRPADPSVSIRSASLIVERRIDLNEVEASAAWVSPFAYQPSSDLSQPISVTSSAPDSYEARQETYASDFLPSRSSSTVDTAISSATITSRTALVTPPSESRAGYSSSPPVSPGSRPSSADAAQPNKTVVSTVAAAEGAAFALDKETNVWSKTISLTWPAARSQWKWAMGESMRGCLGAVTFWVRVKVCIVLCILLKHILIHFALCKVIVTSPSSGTESIDLAPREILVVLTNDADRRQAQAHYTEARASSKGRASNPLAARPTTSPQSASNAHINDQSSRDVPPPLTSSYHRYGPPKSADVSSTPSTSTSPSGRHTHLPMPEASTSSSPPPSGRMSSSSALATFSKVIPTKKKSRRPHTSAGPRDSADVQIGGTMPVPIPVPSPSTGYSSSGSASSQESTSPFFSRHKRRASSSRQGPSLGPGTTASSSSNASHSQPSTQTRSAEQRRAGAAEAARDEGAFRTLNTDFTGMNGIGGPGAMALLWSQQQRRREAEEWERERDRRELIREWEEELAQTEKASAKRGSGSVLGFLGGLGRKKAKATPS